MRSGTPRGYERETRRLILSLPPPYFCSSPLNDWQLPLESKVLSFVKGCEISGRRIQGYERRTKLPEIGQGGGLAEGSRYLWVLFVLAGSDHCWFLSTAAVTGGIVYVGGLVMDYKMLEGRNMTKGSIRPQK